MDNSRCLELLGSAASDSGVKYELKIAALIFIRAKKNGYMFELFRNVKVARPFDDVIIRLSKGNESWLFLVQLKHGEDKDKQMDLQAFCPMKNKGAKNEKGDFNLRKYYPISDRLYQIHNGEGVPPNEDEKILKETPLDRVWFLIYTNKIIKNIPQDTETKQSHEDKVMDEIFTTSPRGSFFCFDESQKNIWSQMDGDERTERIYKEVFLPRLKVFHGQIHVEDLDERILSEMKTVIGTPLPEESEKNMLESFLQEMEKWTKEPTGISLTQNNPFVEQAVAQELRRRIQEAGGLLQFKEEQLKPVESFLDETNQTAKRKKTAVWMQISIRDVPTRLRASKILQVLQNKDCYKDKWVYVDDWLLETFPLQTITLPFRAIDFLVIDLPEQKKFEKFHQMVKTTGRKIPLCVVELTNEDTDKATEQWSLDYLATDCQTKLLQRSVNFQGLEVELGDLEDSWPLLRSHLGGAALGELVGGRTIDIGVPLPDLDPLYIDRKLQHEHCRIVLQSIMDIRSEQDHFVLKKFPADILQQLRKHDSPWVECDASWKLMSDNCVPKSLTADKSNDADKSKLIRTKWTLEKGNTKTNLVGNKNIHWLTVQGREIIWEKSHRHFDIILQHCESEKSCLEAKSKHCEHKNAIDFLNWTDKCIILADSPGKGKSTFLTYMARATKLRHKSNWVIVIRLNDGNIFETLPEKADDIKERNVLDILFSAVSLPGRKQSFEYKEFLKAAFLESGCINIFVDGVDEVCPANKKRAVRLLEIIRETSAGKLWVATRPVLEDDLKTVLHCRTPLSLLPYSRDDQIKYILERWKDKFDGVEQKVRELQVAYFVDTVRMVTSTGDMFKEMDSLCDLPLYTRMLADVYSNIELQEDEHFLELLHKQLHRLNLYKSFVTKTIEGMWEKDGLSKGKRENLGISWDDILEKHKNYAAVECFDDKEHLISTFPSLKSAMQQIVTSYQIEKQVRPGLISSIVNGKPSFVHYTIVEFLGAWWLFDMWTLVPNNVLCFVEQLYSEKYSVCRYFFDAFLAEGWTIHEIILNWQRRELLADLTESGEQNHAENNNKDVRAAQKDSGGRSPLHLAAIIGDSTSVKMLMQAGADPNAEDQVLGWTPLRYADSMFQKASRSTMHLEIIELLLESGGNSSHIPKICSDINSYQDIVNRHHLHIILAMLKENIPPFLKCIAKSNYLEKTVIDDRCDILKILLGNEGFLKMLSGPYKNLTRLLFVAVEYNNENACQVLLETWCDANETDKEKNTALIWAAKNGNENICRVLLSKGANVDAKNREGNTSLMLAAKAGNVEISQLLIDEGASVDEVNNINYTPLLFASEAGQERTCQLLIDKGADINVDTRNDNTPLHIAVIRRHENVCRLLIDNGADIEKKSIWKWFKDHDKHNIHFAADVGSKDFCRSTLQNGTDPNTSDKQCRTPLMFAALKGHLETTTILLNNGANVDSKDKKGWTSLMFAAMEGHDQVCASLIQNNANVNATNKDGNTALSLAAQYGHNDVCRMLIENKGQVNGKNKNKSTPLILAAGSGHESVCRTLIYRQADVNAQDSKTNTPLHVASIHGHLDVCRILLVNGSNIQARNNCGDSPLHAAAGSGHEAICRLLLTFGADINAKNDSEDTPIHHAARFGHERVCEVLIANGALPNERNRFKLTPTDEAFSNKHNSLYNILKMGDENELVNTPGLDQ